MAVVQAVRLADNSGRMKQISATADKIAVAGLELTAAVAATLYNDNNVTGITLGGGTGLTGAAAVNIDAGANGGVTITAGSTSDITFDARNMTTPVTFNESGNEDLSGSFSASSIIGALNELKAAGGGSTRVSLGSPTVNGQTSFDVGQATAAPRVWHVNGVDYPESEGWFTTATTTFADDTWIWANYGAIGELQTKDLLSASFGVV